jgi:large subunit ribosomal protein L3
MYGFAKKLGMTRIFVEGKALPVTAIQFDKQFILQRKELIKDGYEAVQIAAFPKHRTNKSKTGHVKKFHPDQTNFQTVEEFKVTLDSDITELDINGFSVNDTIDITGLTIGKGFTGVVKRWGFHGQPASHGHDHVRAPGSIGMRWPQRTVIGKKMAGHSGHANQTLRKAKILAIDLEQNLLFVKGSMPGPNGGVLKILKNK